MSALCTLALHFGFGAEQACSAAARVTSSPVHLGQPLLPALAVWVSSCTRRLLTPRCAACGSTLRWVCFPFEVFYDILLVLVYARDVHVPGRTDVFSRPRQRGASCIALRMSSLLPVSSAVSSSSGAAGRVFPAATEYNFQSSAE